MDLYKHGFVLAARIAVSVANGVTGECGQHPIPVTALRSRLLFRLKTYAKNVSLTGINMDLYWQPGTQ